MTLYHITPAENLPGILSAGLEPRIGPRSALIGETVPAVYLFPDRATAEDAVMRWLGDALDDHGQLLLIELSLPEDTPLRGPDSGYERLCHTTIGPENIRSVREI